MEWVIVMAMIIMYVIDDVCRPKTIRTTLVTYRYSWPHRPPQDQAAPEIRAHVRTRARKHA